ncbi:tyrosine-type recombinase/integrase [Streptomyces sp. NPDC056704]|uniref:tyrosine-type recombinase/integrase n=1 Tax=Streptomyces sp. NPDC056704 TaxID=3345917 RepID=UPI0036824104
MPCPAQRTTRTGQAPPPDQRAVRRPDPSAPTTPAAARPTRRGALRPHPHPPGTGISSRHRHALQHDGRTYRRVLTEEDLTLARGGHRSPVRVRDDTGQLVQIEAEEETAFWDWAAVETLRHSGVRIEEMCEVSHLSIRHYQRNNGEMVALLVISPSKTDRERVIPMSAELFHVIASVIRRHTRDGNSVPILRRFDPHDKVWSPPMPFLFQRKIGSARSVISPQTVLNMLARRCKDLAEHHPAFRSVKFTPHDFRRIFTTELVNSGLPIHIGATLLGHLNIQTTRGYVAVFDEDVIRHYLAHLNERRQLRPNHEYRDVTSEVGRVRRAFRQAQGRTRRMRTSLRHPLPARTRLYPVSHAPGQPEDDQSA